MKTPDHQSNTRNEDPKRKQPETPEQTSSSTYSLRKRTKIVHSPEKEQQKEAKGNKQSGSPCFEQESSSTYSLRKRIKANVITNTQEKRENLTPEKKTNEPNKDST